jgi:hypothetical protein
VGQDRVIGIKTHYGPESLGIESWWRRVFPHPFRPVFGPNQPPIKCVPGVFSGVKWPGCGINQPPPASTEVKEKVQLYFYYSSGPSWPVLLYGKLHLLPFYCKIYEGHTVLCSKQTFLFILYTFYS